MMSLLWDKKKILCAVSENLPTDKFDTWGSFCKCQINISRLHNINNYAGFIVESTLVSFRLCGENGIQVCVNKLLL